MICHLFKHKRRRNGKVVESSHYYGKFRVARGERIVVVPLDTKDKQVARKLLNDLVREKQQERAGIIAPKPLRDAASNPLAEHLADYVADLAAKGRDEMYVYNVEHRCLRLTNECGWKFAKDVTPDSFVTWRAKQTKAPKTLNEFLDAARGLLNWMHRNGRIVANALLAVGKVETRGRETRKRRAFTDEQMRSLLAVAGPRKVVYLTAVFTGLRRAELEALRKGDFHLYCDNPFVKARASTTKNHKEAVLWLHPEAVGELRKLIPPSAPVDEMAFDPVPSMDELRADLRVAGIPFMDGEGRRADFHAFRHTLATNLARAGVPPRIAMEFMRHSDLRMTNKTYTDATGLPLAEAVERLPWLSKRDTQRSTQKNDASRHLLSSAGTEAETREVHKPSENMGECHALALTVAERHEREMVPRLGLEPRTN